MKIRNSVKAIIRRGDSILLLRKRHPDGDYFVFPGGGQEVFEDMRSTLRRECLEEIGVEVKVEDVVLIREYIGRNHEFSATDSDLHQVEIYFSCRIPEGAVPANGSQIDDGQVAVEWIRIEEFSAMPIYPQSLKAEFIRSKRIYCGDAN